ncbi:MAG: hypothetical protein JW910_07135 [Anaerolineae bacterium]|nr:hypothetical protein [Anaerolineae bacterium]
MKQDAKGEAAAAAEFDQVRQDIQALTHDLTALLESMKTIAVEESGEALSESVEAIGRRTRALYEKVAAQGEQSAKAVGREIEARPVVSLLVAFAVGFCISRFISR